MNEKRISLSAAALIAGSTLVVMVVAAIFAELFVFPKLIDTDNALQTMRNMLARPRLFTAGLFAYLITFMGDMVLAWALYILLRPVNKDLSLLAAVFRLVFAVIAIGALLQLVTIYRLLLPNAPATRLATDWLPGQLLIMVNAFRFGYHFAILFFAVHLAFVGCLVLKCAYIPSYLGVLLLISSAGYLITMLQPFWYRGIRVDFATYTYYGEIIFMFWLIIRGKRIREPDFTQPDATGKRI